MAIKISGSTIIDDSRNIVSGAAATFTGNVTIGGTLTYEDVTNIDSVGLITARNGIVVGSGITLSKDGDGFFTGIVTATQYYGDGSTLSNVTSTTINNNGTSRIVTGSSIANTLNAKSNLIFDNTLFQVGSGITISKSGDIFATGVVTATSYAGDGSQLTGLQAGKFVTDGVGITTSTPVGIETTTLARKDLTGPAGNTATGAGSSFHGAYMGDGFLSFNTEFSNPTGYYISTFTNALVCGPMQLGTTLSIDGTFTIV